jgi:hypothetical protein
MKKNPLSISFRSAIQATDSTKGMQRKHSGNRGAEGEIVPAGRLAAHPCQCKKKQNRIAYMEGEVGPVMESCIQAEHLAIGHVAEPRERPVQPLPRRKRPANTLKGKTVLHRLIRGDVHIVVVIAKTVPGHRLVRKKRNDAESDNDRRVKPEFRHDERKQRL